MNSRIDAKPGSQSEHASPTRRRLLATVVIAACFGISLHFACRRPEPTYQGKTAQEWFKQFQSASDRYWKSLPSNRNLPGRARIFDQQALFRDPAADGLRALGTNAAIYLGKEFARGDGPLARGYAKFYLWIPAVGQRLLPQPYPRFSVRMQMGWALESIGDSADAAAPMVLAALLKEDRTITVSSLELLKHMRFDRTQLDSALTRWSRQGLHRQVLNFVSELRLRTPVAAECLARALSQPDRTFRQSCMYQLGQFGDAAAPAIPVLIALLKASDEELRYTAARALEDIGRAAAPAAPALLQAMNDKSPMVQRSSARALLATRESSSPSVGSELSSQMPR